MKRRYPKLIDLLVENEDPKELIVFDEDDPAMQIKAGNVFSRFFKKLKSKIKKKPTLKFDDEKIAGDPDSDVPTLNFPEEEVKGDPNDAIMRDLKLAYEFRLGNTMQDAQKIVGKPKISGEKPITFLVTKEGGVFMRVPGESGFGKLEGDYKELSGHVVELYKELGGKMLNEGLSRGSLYRRRYYGRY